jgi:archaellum component FlaG (FlaF/FlaG flagellin family)
MCRFFLIDRTSCFELLFHVVAILIPRSVVNGFAQVQQYSYTQFEMNTECTYNFKVKWLQSERVPLNPRVFAVLITHVPCNEREKKMGSAGAI